MILSKEESNYPEHGNIRTISMLSAAFKLYKIILQMKVNEEVARLNYIPIEQKGFVNGCSTFDNLIDLMIMIKEARRKEQVNRANRIRVANRVRT